MKVTVTPEDQGTLKAARVSASDLEGKLPTEFRLTFTKVALTLDLWHVQCVNLWYWHHVISILLLAVMFISGSLCGVCADGADVLAVRSGLSGRHGLGWVTCHQTGDLHDGAPQHRLPGPCQAASPGWRASLPPQKSTGWYPFKSQFSWNEV